MFSSCSNRSLVLCVMMCCGPNLSSAAITQREATALTSEDLAALLQRVQANVVANERNARQYACDDQTHTVTLKSNGKKIRDSTAKFEYAVVDGIPYIHKVEEDGEPLSASKMASEQKHQDAIQEIGRVADFIFDLRDGNPHDSVYSALPECCLTTMFENRVLRHEELNGRDNLVVESVPKADVNPSSPYERTALDWKEITWIDVDDLIPTRYEVELLNDKGFLLKGSTERREFFRMEEVPHPTDRLPGAVWLMRKKQGHYNLKFLWEREFETFEDTSSNYKKFTVNMRVIPD